MSWAFARLRRKGPSAFALTLAVTRVEELEPRSLGNVVWAFAKLLLDDRGHRGHVGHVATLAAAAQRRAAEMNPQGVANTLWAFGKLKHYDQPLLDTVVNFRIAVNCRNFKVQELVNTVWAFATLQCLDLTLLKVVEGEMMSRMARCEGCSEKRQMRRIQPQDVSNLVWSLGTLRERPLPLLMRLASRAPATEFEAQHLANVAWAFAALRLRHEELMRVIQREALGRCSSFAPTLSAPSAGPWRAQRQGQRERWRRWDGVARNCCGGHRTACAQKMQVCCSKP